MESTREFQLAVCSTLTGYVIRCFVDRVEMNLKSNFIKSRNIAFSPLLIKVNCFQTKLTITWIFGSGVLTTTMLILLWSWNSSDLSDLRSLNEMIVHSSLYPTYIAWQLEVKQMTFLIINRKIVYHRGIWISLRWILYL